MAGVIRQIGCVLALLLATTALACGVCSSSAAARDALVAQTQSYPRLPMRADLVGVWETRNVEQGRDVAIAWIVKDDGTLDYEFVVDGQAFRGSTGTWQVDGDGMLTERWNRDGGTVETGRASLQLLDANTLKLTIIDNGEPSYTGKVRIYRRRGAPQIT